MNQLTERLYGADHPGYGVGPAAGGAIDRDHRTRRRTAQIAEEPALETEVDPQPLRDREHKLPVRHLGADMLGHPAGLLQRPLLVARRAEATAPAGIRDQESLAALGTADAGEAVLEARPAVAAKRRRIAAIEKLAHHGPDDGPLAGAASDTICPRCLAQLGQATWLGEITLQVTLPAFLWFFPFAGERDKKRARPSDAVPPAVWMGKTVPLSVGPGMSAANSHKS